MRIREILIIKDLEDTCVWEELLLIGTCTCSYGVATSTCMISNVRKNCKELVRFWQEMWEKDIEKEGEGDGASTQHALQQSCVHMVKQKRRKLCQ